MGGEEERVEVAEPVDPPVRRSQQRGELTLRVASPMAVNLVVRAPEELAGGHGEKELARRLADPAQLEERGGVALDVFQHVAREHAVEGPIDKGQRLEPAGHEAVDPEARALRR